MTIEPKEHVRLIDDDEVREYAKRYLRRAIALLDAGQATGALVILVDDDGLFRDWFALPMNKRRVTSELANVCGNLEQFFRTAWSAHPDNDRPTEIDGSPVAEVVSPTEEE